jgi:hypothetical protein
VTRLWESNGGACETSTSSREPVASPSRAGEVRGEADSRYPHKDTLFNGATY